METPPWEPPPMVAYRLNGEEIPLERGGPVRMVVPWAHGFKSIKWLQRIVLTNDYKANDTYALQNNDPESYLKTAAYLGQGELTFKAGEPIEIEGTAMAGWSGLERVEYWLRPATAADGKARRRRPGLEDGGLAPLRDHAAARRLGRDPARGHVAEGRLGLRPDDRQAQELAAALQHGPVDGPAGGAEARLVRVPRPHRGPQRLRPARAAAVSEVGHEPGAVQGGFSVTA